MSVYNKVSNTWKDIVSIRKKINGTWKLINAVWVKINGVWKNVITNIPENIIIFVSTDPGGNWKILNGTDNNPDLIGMYLRGGNSEGSSPSGSDTHSHSSTNYTSGNPNELKYVSDGSTSGWLDRAVHNHTANHGHSSINNEPLYYKMIPCAGGAAIPANTLLFYDGSTAPTGWTAWTSVYNRFIKCETVAGEGSGALTHTHSITMDTSYTALGYNRRCEGSCAEPCSAYSNHCHSFNHSHTDGQNYPVWYGLLPIRNDNFTVDIPSGVVAFFKGSIIPDGWTEFTSLSTSNKFVHCKSTNGETGGVNSHNHSHGIATGWTGSTRYADGGGYAHARYSHTHTISGDHTTVDNIPYHRQMLICKKD